VHVPSKNEVPVQRPIPHVLPQLHRNRTLVSNVDPVPSAWTGFALVPWVQLLVISWRHVPVKIVHIICLYISVVVLWLFACRIILVESHYEIYPQEGVDESTSSSRTPNASISSAVVV
jgi:hypothetical protein